MELYRASKAALNSLTRSLVAKLDRPLTVLSLHPGWVRTDMGGASADLDVETSVRGLVDVILARRGTPGSAFLDYSGAELPW
jgi:NAD(P)-dependent dehydrogenase (short-subunit alcohol dehydrogenase family)